MNPRRETVLMELNPEKISLEDITANTLAAQLEGSFFSWDEGGPENKFGGEVLARLILMEWPINQGNRQFKLTLNALLFEHGRSLLAETFFTESRDEEETEIYLGSSRCYRLNLRREDYSETYDEALMSAIFLKELGVDSDE